MLTTLTFTCTSLEEDMGRIVEYTVQLIQAGQRAYDRKWIFLGFFATTFLASVLILGRLGLLPEAKLVTAGKLQELLLEAVTAIIAENAKPGAKVDAELVKLLGEADAFFSSFAVRVHEYLEREKK